MEQGSQGSFDQFGGEVTVGVLILNGGVYNLHTGMMRVYAISVGTYGSGGSFNQEGGTNSIGSLRLTSGSPQNSTATRYALTGGTLMAEDVSVGKAGTFSQSDGLIVVTNSLTISGGVNGRSPPFEPVRALYELSGGALSAGSLVLLNSIGGTSFRQFEGATSISGVVDLAGFEYAYAFIGKFQLAGGLFSCSGFTNSGGAMDIEQDGGALVVTNLFQFAGFAGREDYYLSPRAPRWARYHFNGGTLCAGNIELTAEWIIGSSSEAGRISNPGWFKMSGFLTISNATERLGRFVLASNAFIHLAGTCTSLSFADSSSEGWSSNAILVVTNASGGSSGEGSNQLKFGTNQFGLRPDQLARIRFRTLDPSRLYTARILNTGQIVPDQPVSGAVRILEESQKLILDWEPGWLLQTATNVAGPYEDLPEATPPYTNNLSTEPERFFRLR